MVTLPLCGLATLAQLATTRILGQLIFGIVAKNGITRQTCGHQYCPSHQQSNCAGQSPKRLRRTIKKYSDLTPPPCDEALSPRGF